MKAICLDQSENDQGSITVQCTLKSEACDNLVYIKCQLRSIVICLFVKMRERCLEVYTVLDTCDKRNSLNLWLMYAWSYWETINKQKVNTWSTRKLFIVTALCLFRENKKSNGMRKTCQQLMTSFMYFAIYVIIDVMRWISKLGFCDEKLP